MKDFVRKATAFITFETHLEVGAMRQKFVQVHKSYQQQFQHWTFSASRKKVVADFWFRQVFYHFFAIIFLAMALTVPFEHFHYFLLTPVTLGVFFVAISLTIFDYAPTFYADFLPKLDTIIAEQEKLATEEDDLKKCKRSQYSIPTLTIIFHVWCKMAQIPIIPVNDHSATLLNQLYGADKDKLKQNMARLYKFSFLSPREKAEMQKGISTARLFFQELNHPSSGTLLDEMENKLLKA